MLGVAFRLALREMRGGLRDFPVLLICLSLGVAAIAAVGSIRAAIQAGLESEAARILGGDAQLQFTYRFATDQERAWMADNSVVVSELADFRSMALVKRDTDTDRSLTQVQAVDGTYPLYGELKLDPDISVREALETRDLPGIVAQQALLDRLDVSVGDAITLGTQDFELRAVIVSQPDGAAGFNFGPRSIVRLEALENSGLLAAGTLFDSAYRLKVAPDTDLAMLQDGAEAQFRDDGLRWRDARNASPGTRRFVERIGAFLILVGIAGLIVGGIGVSAAVRSYLSRKTKTIATLKTVGARGRDVFAVYLIQIGILALIGISAGLILGAILPLIAGRLFGSEIPLPAVFAVYPRPLAEAAIYGVLTALIFSLWPLARTRDVRAAGLFRDVASPIATLPHWHFLVLIFALVAALVVLAATLSGVPRLTYWIAAGLAASLVVLAGAAYGIQRLARRLASGKLMRGRPALHLALRAIGGPGADATSVILSIGLGLTVLAAISQIDANLRGRINEQLPEISPSYFVVDIQDQQLDPFLIHTDGIDAVTDIETAPMLRGVVTRINDTPAQEVAGEHWVLRGDRGLSYGDVPPRGATITEGTWWEDGYTGPPLMSFAAEEAEEMGLTIGDTVTVNVLGRDITATIANLRVVDFSNMGINFVMIVNAAALRGAPHSHIATVYADVAADKTIVRSLGETFPNVTAIRVRDAIDRVADALGAIATATRWGASVTLLTGFVVLIGAAAAGEKRRTYEAAVLKTLGATRARVLSSFALRSAILGGAAGAIALLAGIAAAWGVMRFVMEAEFAIEPVSAIIVVVGGALANLVAGLIFSYRSLSASAASVLRSSD